MKKNCKQNVLFIINF